jgi:predicted flap endonuclease-1-like 5' DNA nuclease/outer membrane murein-binding lipoprotein Lpp
MFEQNVTLGPGTGTFANHTLEILIMLTGAFLLGLWLGWALWAKYKQQIDKLSLENQSLNASVEALRAEVAQAKEQLTSLEFNNLNLNTDNSNLNLSNSKLLEKIANLEAGLANAEQQNRVLDTELGLLQTPDDAPAAVDIPLEIEEPKTPDPVVVEEPVVVSPVTVAMAENAPAPSIIEPIALVDTPVEKKRSSKKAEGDKNGIAVVAAAGSSEDLTVIEGIGPKIQMLLNQYGIYTYRQLAETEVERLKEILSTAGPQLAMHDPGTWPSQANLAANDQWDTLKSVQGFLKGGKKPT